jgi:hypothetical protein
MSRLFKKVAREVEKRISKNPSLSLDIVAEEAMNKYRVPSTEDTRESFLHALREKERKEKKGKPESEEIKKELPKERADEKQKVFSEEIMRKLKAGAREMQIRTDIEKGILEGEISKENLVNPSFRYEGRRPKDLGFGPPR